MNILSIEEELLQTEQSPIYIIGDIIKGFDVYKLESGTIIRLVEKPEEDKSSLDNLIIVTKRPEKGLCSLSDSKIWGDSISEYVFKIELLPDTPVKITY